MRVGSQSQPSTKRFTGARLPVMETHLNSVLTTTKGHVALSYINRKRWRLSSTREFFQAYRLLTDYVALTLKRTNDHMETSWIHHATSASACEPAQVPDQRLSAGLPKNRRRLVTLTSWRRHRTLSQRPFECRWCWRRPALNRALLRVVKNAPA
jgi:hypothetical protein